MSEVTRESRRAGRLTTAPAILLLFVWMIVPLAMTVYFSTQNYVLLDPENRSFAGLENFTYFLSSASFLNSLLITLKLVGSVLLITVVLGVLISVLVDAKFPGQGVVRMLLISPFFIMPTVSALIWKNLLMNPVSGLFAWLFQWVGLTPINWFSDWPLLSVIIIVAWEWLPFAILIFVTSLQSMDQEQKEAAQMDGATPLSIFRYLTLPHLARPIAVVVMVQTIFLLNIFAEIFTTTNGGPGDATTNMPYLVFTHALLEFDVGTASAGGLVAVVFANVVAALLLRVFGKSLTEA
ncbi:carbohydrate ABC transporter permease [Stigmatella aurantiaca]|uniref:Binding-protein-dependent transport systems inner membrane component n=1 Tax=Stigmatella aurantiaca (strain DW4/3-1) TaxID=378806 RepID=Q094G5_STIAD|nr:sugar ABC transporter permease [Stigmatella aurantiaca]ADO68175.1 Binding-protein-dependent transport systems inner membrane component [Stigmatella aurantiaca DW4/3-1]EAU67097.1 binding-protein-dependent transport systems inner membrane component [Stigmatella aurantiaca DW4/3-1]